MSFFGNRLKYVSCKVWDSTLEGFEFPEIGDPEYKVEGLSAKPNVGIAFSGGGTRAAAAALGQLRGLNELGLLNRARYVSCVSGGSWTCVPFTYLPEAWPDETFLGQVIPPGDLTLDSLKKTDRNSFAHAIANSAIIDDFFKNTARLASDETYSRALGDIFLKAFDIDSLGRFFSLNRDAVAAVLNRNTHMTADDFYCTRPNRPFLIVNAIVLRTTNQPPQPRRIHFETTPLYAGVKALHKGAGSQGRDIGGGYVESFGFDSAEPESHSSAASVVTVRLGASRHRYTLSDVIGSSGAAPAEVLDKLGLDWVGFPEFRYWPPGPQDNKSAREYEFGDGGILENLGIMPLLTRKVRRIVVFVNSNHVLRGPEKDRISDSIPPLFGQTPDFTTNHVFPGDRFQPLVDGLLASKGNGGTVMFKDTYSVLDNSHYGVVAGWDAEVLWVYNDRVAAWENQLPKTISRQIGFGSLGNFPHYRTFFQNPPAAIDLSAKQVNLLASLSCWNVTSNKQVFEGMFS